MWVKKQQLEPCVEQLIDSILRKVYDSVLCSHSLAYMPSYKLESRQAGEISTTSDMWMIPL